MRYVKGLIAAVLVLMVAACGASGAGGSGHGKSSRTSRPADAMALCRAALPTRHVVSGKWTTVGETRSWSHGPPSWAPPLAHAFPGVPDSAPAAWCWTEEAPDDFTAWGATPPHSAARAIEVVGPTNGVIPSGMPIVP